MVDTPAQSAFEIDLQGCRPEPLASYLKALGILRLVAEQKDAAAHGCWRGEHFVLHSRLDRDALVRFFSEEWQPTPVVAPWNGGSGFYPNDNRDAADALVGSQSERLRTFAESIAIGRAFVNEQGLAERPADDEKKLMLSAMRARLPDRALAWLDAAVMVGDDRLLFPPLLGTGGNDGRLDFSNNYQQRVVEVCSSTTSAALESALFGVAATIGFKGAMGQFQPAASGRSNPWDFVFLIEGTLAFAAAATRRYESTSPSRMAFPFHARAAGGHSSLSEGDAGESRDELWLPLWSTPASMWEISRLFAEGRASVGSGDSARDASSALDFARAVTSLGVDRGVESFIRVGFHLRNGLAYFATPLGRFSTGDVAAARLLDCIDGWYHRLRSRASGKNVPSTVVLAHRRLEQAMFDTAEGRSLGRVLLALGDCERVLARAPAFVSRAFLKPIAPLPQAWAAAVMDSSPEQRLAAALAARTGMRGRLVSLDRTGRTFGPVDEASVAFTERPLVDNLHSLLLREDIEATQGHEVSLTVPAQALCSLTDIARFIDHNVDDVLIERWLRALVLIEGRVIPEVAPESVLPPASFAILALVHNRSVGETVLPRTVGVLARACAGDAARATEAAIRRLNACSRPFPVPSLFEPVGRTRRIAAALSFPLSVNQRRTLEGMVLRAVDAPTKSSTDSSTLELTP